MTINIERLFALLNLMGIDIRLLIALRFFPVKVFKSESVDIILNFIITLIEELKNCMGFFSLWSVFQGNFKNCIIYHIKLQTLMACETMINV